MTSVFTDAQLRAIWDEYDAISDEFLGPDEMADVAITPELTRRIEDSLMACGVLPSLHWRERVKRRRSMRTALQNPYHLDRIAVRRAMGFDWPVIENLSDRERDVFYETLAAMEDPYDSPPRKIPGVAHAKMLNQMAYQPTRRRLAYERHTVQQRDRVQTGIKRWRKYAAAQAQPIAA
jgi:hypothetical protein